MSYVESFKAVMDEVRILMADCDMPFLDKLQAAHDAEMKQLSKEEFHRGYESGIDARDANQWQLDRERAKIIEAVRKVVPEGYFGSDEMLSEICRAIYSPVFGWTAEAGRYLCDRLIYLLGGKSINKGAETSAKVIQNGEKYQLATYDVLANERHKAVCELRKMRLDTGTAIKKLAVALGIRWNAANTPKSCALIQSRLIHLLGGDDETASNDDRTCPIPVQSPSITDELREFATGTELVPGMSLRRSRDTLLAIADRIDAQFNRICSQHESVLQQTVSETVDEHEQEMAELRQKLSARDAIISNYHQRMKATESKCEELRKKYTELADHTIDIEARLADYVGQYDPTDAKVIELKCTLGKLRTELGEYAEAVMRDYVRGAITREEAVERIERLKNAGS